MSDVAQKKNDAARRRHNKKHGVSTVYFEIGDFVLSGNVIRRNNKPMLHRRGPFRIATTLDWWIYEIQVLAEPLAIIARHVTRLKFHSDRDLEITQDFVRLRGVCKW